MKETFEKKEGIKIEVTSHTAPEGELASTVRNLRPGVLDMVIAFDTTGSMSMYIEDVRRQVSDLVPRLFADNPDLRLGIVAFGDYCDMEASDEFGDAYQSLPLTQNCNDIISFIRSSRNTSGGDSDEFYELVLHKIIEETDWREDADRTILLIADADPHPLGYTYEDLVKSNNIDWRCEMKRAAQAGIQIDTVQIRPLRWLSELSTFTNGVSIPFRTGEKTASMVEATVSARGSYEARSRWDARRKLFEKRDMEMKAVYDSLERKRNSVYDPYELQRFVTAQDGGVYERALSEIKGGRKSSHWMWYIFPQLRGLGHSRQSHFYGITSLDEAKAYMNHPVLGPRLIEICKALMDQPESNVVNIFGMVDACKLQSSMTLFEATKANPVFAQVLERFLGDHRCETTLKRIPKTSFEK